MTLIWFSDILCIDIDTYLIFIMTPNWFSDKPCIDIDHNCLLNNKWSPNNYTCFHFLDVSATTRQKLPMYCPASRLMFWVLLHAILLIMLLEMSAFSGNDLKTICK